MNRTRNVCKCRRTFLFFVMFGLVLTSIQGHVLEFTVEPRDTVVVSGSSAVLDCAAQSSEFPRSEIMIQWHDKDRQPLTFVGDTYRSQLINGSLYISSVIEDQGLTGTYYCRAVLPKDIGSIVSRTATVSLANLSGFQQEPRDISVFPGQKAYFACRVQATPPPRVRWLKDERPLQMDEIRMTVLPSGALEIDEVQYSDQGTYRCNASGLNQYRLSNKATLAIHNDLERGTSTLAPAFIATPRSQEVVEGQTITLDCAANGFPKPRITWLKDGINLDMADLDSRFRTVGGGTSSLQISNIQEVDAGTYQCRAENREDSVDATATIKVQVPPRFHKQPGDKIEAQHYDVEFECSIHGKPEPEIRWLKNGEVIKYNDYMQLVNGHNLKILGLMEIDSGIYQCVGNNPAGNVQASARLKVIPTVSKPPKKLRNNSPHVNSKRSDDVKPTKTQLRDILSSLKQDDPGRGDSLGKAEFGHSVMSPREYTFNGKPNQKIDPISVFTSLKSSEEHDVSSINVGSALPVFTEPALNSKTYRVLDKDFIASSGQEGLPGPPQDLKAVIVKARFVTLSWKAPEITNGEIIAYSVFYRQEGSKRERVQNTTRSRLEEVNIGSLTPGRVYHFRVVAYNWLGHGPSSDSLKIVTQPEENVPSAPLHVQAHATSPSSIHVQWHEPEVANGQIMLYKVYYLESDSSVEHNMDTPNLSIDLVSLNMFTEYSIWVVAVNQNGAGASSAEVTAKTFSAAPSEPPYNVTVEPGSSTTIIVRWEPPPVEGQNGIITGYKIRYRKHGRKGDTITTPGNTRMHTLTNLERSSSYQIRICAININGSGPPTDWLTVETYPNDLDEKTVPEEPGPLKTRPSTDSITVQWTPPPNQNIKVRQYLLSWGIGFPDSNTLELDEKERSYVIKDLEPNSEYVIRLQASNKIGPGKARYATVRTRDELPPEPATPLIPPVGLKADVISENTVVLYWTDSLLSKSQLVTDNRYYIVRYAAVGNQKYRFYNASDLNCMIVDLKPNTLYEFAVRVVKGRRESSWSMVVQNTTLPAAPSTAPRDLTVFASTENSQAITLTWQPPKMPNGPITGYIILYTTDNSKRDRDWSVEGIMGDKNVAQLLNLQPSTTYFFKVQARNNKGNGPFSPVVSFRTGESSDVLSDSRTSKDGKNGAFSSTMMLCLAIGGSIVLVTIIGVIIVVICCRRRDPNTTPDRTKKGYQKGMAKNQGIKPPDLWIHHDQMELKALEKGHSSNDGASSSGAMTLPRSVGANEYDTHESQPSNSLDKRNYVPSYMGASSDDKNRRVVKPKPITLPVESKPPREPIATATPINTAPINQVNPAAEMVGGVSARPPYPRTQYTISRAHVTIDQNAMVNPQPPENPYAMQSAYDSVTPAPTYQNQGPTVQPHMQGAPSGYAPGMNVISEAQGGKRLQGHPLKSFSVPAPPPTSAPGTPQPKHVVPPQVTVRPNSSPYKKAPTGPQGTPTSRISASNPSPHTAEEVQRLAPSYSTEELNQEMANLEGLMKDLNAITASEFEMG